MITKKGDGFNSRHLFLIKLYILVKVQGYFICKKPVNFTAT
ncbi:MAG: hypothetical protein RR048_02710 [Oscillospiraceae bacterium]